MKKILIRQCASLLLFVAILPLKAEIQADFLSKDTYAVESSDRLQFGRLWKQIKRLQKQGALYPMIRERKQDILAQKNHWKRKIAELEDPTFLKKIQDLLQEGTIVPVEHGLGGAYFLLDKTGTPQYVIKPVDEDILCINNRKHFASPYFNRAFRVRDEIPLYRSAQAEALSYSVAKLLDLSDLTPTTHLAVIESESFFDITDHLEHPELEQRLGKPDREKFCSVQQFLPEMENLLTLVETWLRDKLPEEKILGQIDQKHFENLLLLIWLLYDTDAHAGNLYVLKQGSGTYKLCKIDNGLTFPEKNAHLLNALFFLPHAKKRPTPDLRQRVQEIPTDEIEKRLSLFEMDASLEAFRERLAVLKHLICEKNLSLREIDMRLRALEFSEGKEIAMGDVSLSDLEKLLSY